MKLSETFDKNYLSKVALYLLTAVAALGAIIYMAYHLIDRFSPGLELIDAKPKTITQVISADAYIMRDEEPVYSRNFVTGSVVPLVSNGEKLSVNQKIADVYSNVSPDTEARLSEINELIALLQKSVDSDRTVQSPAGMDSAIFDTVFDIRSLCESGDYAEVLSMKTSLLLDIKERNILTGSGASLSSQITKLEAEKASLKSQLGANLGSVYSESTGYYFEEYDGYGNIFSSENVDTLTFDDFVQMSSSEAENVNVSCVGSMVHDFRWYIACFMKKTDAASLVDKYSCDVTFAYSDKTLSMELYRIIPQTPGDNAVVIFQCEVMPENFDYTRMQPVEISSVEYTGFEVPIEAVRVVSGFEGVYILDEVTVEFRRINIIYEGDGYVICTGDPDEEIPVSEEDKVDVNDELYPWIKQNDIIVVSGTELYSGKVIG
ncbi:MAG: hypothetical protein E7672_06190 [Ruminococcaceae bacterium]|nr:hypothetical protein [Oscillospiraceae bacterium]